MNVRRLRMLKKKGVQAWTAHDIVTLLTEHIRMEEIRRGYDAVRFERDLLYSYVHDPDHLDQYPGIYERIHEMCRTEIDRQLADCQRIANAGRVFPRSMGQRAFKI